MKPRRALSLSIRHRIRPEERASEDELYELRRVPRPQSRPDCNEVPRPCPFVSCKHNLYLEVDVHTGSLRLNFPDVDAADMGESCSLDVADHGGMTLEDVGKLINITRERVRQLEVQGMRNMAKQLAADETEIQGRLSELGYV